MAYFDKREVKWRVMFQTNELPLTPTIIGCGKWIFLCALLLMYGWILLVFVLVNSINPVCVRASEWVSEYLCEYVCKSVCSRKCFTYICVWFPPLFFRAILLYYHELCSVLTELLFGRTSPPLFHHWVWCFKATTASTSIIQLGWHPPWSSSRGVWFWIVQTTLSLLKCNPKKKSKKLLDVAFLLLSCWKLLYHKHVFLFFSHFPRCFFSINLEKGTKIEEQHLPSAPEPQSPHIEIRTSKPPF